MVISSRKISFFLMVIPHLLAVSCSGEKDKPTDGDQPKPPQIVEVRLGYVPVDPNTNVETNLTLRALSNDNDIKFRAHLQYDPLGDVLSDKSLGQRLSVLFDDLSENQFDTLKTVYGGTHNATKYFAGSRYSLADFLPPMMQAMDGYVVTSKEVDANCWGTVYEVQRNSGKSMDLFYVDQREIFPVLNNDKYSTHVATIKPSQGERLEDIDTNFLDAILIVSENQGKQELLHAATLIDRGIIFEKISFQLPYRLNTVGFLYEKYGDAKFIVRRFNKAQLPKGLEAMAGKIKSMATVHFEQREDGRYVLPPKYLQ